MPGSQPGQRKRPTLRAAFACVLLLQSQLLAPVAAAAELPVSCAEATCAGGLSQFATGGSASLLRDATSLTIDQASDRAILNWQSFDVAAGRSVRFRQPNENAVALNRIHDAAPSRILGSIDANGQVYLLNRNGVVFGEGSQVNVGGLVASSLDVSDTLFNGVGIAQAIAQGGAPAFTATGTRGNVTVAPGARITATKGGRVLLAAPEVRNEGTLRADEGQVLLVAARDRLFLQPSPSSDLRGFLVGVGTGGLAVNDGDILVPRGNATLLGAAVNQNGRISASTSVQLNGSIRLVAQTNTAIQPRNGRPSIVPSRTGDVSIGARSLTEVLPELGDLTLAVDDQPQPRSLIEIGGANVDILGGARVRAPSGQLTVIASSRTAIDAPAGARGANTLRIGAGATLDVGGIDSVVLPQSRNLVKVDLRANEFADSPLQRNGILRGDSIVVDARIGTGIALVDAAIASVQRSVGERLALGGDITLAAGGDVLVASGALLDVSGGAIRFEGGLLDTTKVVSNGRLVDIGEASPELAIEGIVRAYTKRHARWGVTETFDGFAGNPAADFVAGYVEGKDAGSLTLRARGGVYEGLFDGTVYAGLFQRRPSGNVAGLDRPFDELPLGGRLAIDLAFDAGVPPRDVRISSVAGTTTAGTALPALPAADHAFALSEAMLEASGLSTLDIGTNGRFALPADVRLAFAGGTTLRVRAASIDWSGGFASAGGELTLRAAQAGATFANIVLGSTADIDVRGTWVNDAPSLGAVGAPLWIDGGNVTLDARGDLDVRRGSTIDVGGGAWLDATGVLRAGVGGDLSLISGIPTGDTVLGLGGAFVGTSVGRAGRLYLEANQVAIIGAPVGVVGGGGGTGNPTRGVDNFLVLPAVGFFDLGFGAYEVVANRYDLRVLDGARLTPIDRHIVLDSGFENVASGTPIERFSSIRALPLHLRDPVDVTLGVIHGDRVGVRAESALRIERGAVVDLHPGSTLTLETDQRMLVNGRLAARGGTVDLHLRPGGAGFRTDQAIWLGADARLDASATTLPIPDDNGLARAETFDAGRIALRADRGWVMALPGSQLDVSGSVVELDLFRSNPDVPERTRVALDAGTIDIRAGEGFSLEGTLRAAAATPDSRGGRFSALLDAVLRSPDGDSTFRVDVDRTVLLGETFAPSGAVFGGTVGARFASRGEVAASTLRAAGFDSVALSAPDLQSTLTPNAFDSFGSVRVVGDLALDLRQRLVLDAGVLAVDRDAVVRLGAAHATLGNGRIGVARGAARGDTGQLQLDAQAIDLVGHLRIDGAAQVDLRAREDIRGIGAQPTERSRTLAGSLATAGNLALTARQVYPATLTEFALQAGRIDVLPSGRAPAPVLSAGGALAFSAQDITIDGAAKAPGGTLALTATRALTVGADGLLSVSLEGQGVPFGRTQGGIDWVYPLARDSVLTRLVGAPPAKRIDLVAPSVSLADGSVLDLQGGGDLLASEFIRGPGGTRDVTDPAFAAGSFAVLPLLGSEFAPHDRLELSGFDFLPGESIELAASTGLASGTYAILPARYALLPGAFLVTPVAGTVDTVPGSTIARADGVPLVAGRFVDRAVQGGASGTSTTVGDSRFTAFAVEPGSAVLARSEISTTSANRFFAALGARTDGPDPELPRDGGTFSVTARERLQLAGDLLAGAASAATAPGGRAGLADISATRLFVGTAGTPAPTGFVGLDVAGLGRLDVGSLLLGGTRTQVADGVFDIAIAAEEVRIADDVALALPELLLVATSAIDVGTGASLTATPASGALAARTLRAGASGAVLALSGTNDIAVVRTAGTGTTGDVRIAGAIGDDPATARRARLSGRSIAVDAARDAAFNGEFIAPGTGGIDGTVGFASRRIALGSPSGEGVLGLDAAALGAAGVRHLALRAGDALDVDAAQALVLDRLDLSTPLLRSRLGDADADLRVQADLVTLTGGSSIAPAAATAGVGRLQLDARRIEIGAGRMDIVGFATTALGATTGVRATAQGTLAVSGAFDVTTPVLSGDGGATLSLASTNDVLRLRTPDGAAATAVAAGLGAQFDLAGERVELDTTVLAPTGRISATARTGDLVIGGRAVLDAAGRAVNVGSLATFSTPGRIDLVAAGDMLLSSGARLDVGAAAGARGLAEPSATGGVLSLTASGQLDVAATLAGAGAALRVDAGVLDAAATPTNELGRLETLAAAGGFEAARSYRQREGDLQFAAAAQGRTTALEVAVDRGRLDLLGRAAVGTRASFAARDGIAFAGASGVDFAQGARGALELRVADPFADIVLGAGSAGTAAVDLGIALPAAADAAARLDLTALPTGSTLTLRPVLAFVEADGVIDAADQQRFADAFGAQAVLPGEARAVLAQAAGVADAALSLRPELVVSSPGDLRVADAWSLVATRDASAPGRLVLRAAGNLDIAADLQDGYRQVFNEFAGIEVERLDTADSFALALVAGADAAAVDPLATSTLALAAGTGDVRIGAGVRVRTGTGDIDLRAARDVRMADGRSTIHSGGRSTGFGNLPFEYTAGQLTGEFGESAIDGGELRIVAGRDYVGARSAQLVSEWLPRFGGPLDGATDGAVRPTVYGVVARAFRQGLGAFGEGGAIHLSAGRDVLDLEAALPQTAQHVGDALRVSNDPFNPKTFDNAYVLRGADLLRVTAGRDLRGGFLYQGQGSADVRAGGDVLRAAGGAGLVIASNDAAVSVIAVGDLRLEQAFDAALAPIDDAELQLPFDNVFFFTYGTAGRLSLTSIAGDLTLGNDRTRAFAGRGRNPFVFGTDILPASLTATALAGDIVLESGFTLFPGARGGLVLAAGDALRTAPRVANASVVVSVSDADPALLPSRERAVGDTSDAAQRLPASGFGRSDLLHAAVPVHAGDRDPVRLIAAAGDADVRALQLLSAEAVRVEVARDLQVDQINIQHANPDDVSRILVGRDFRFLTPRDQVTGAIGRGNSRVDVAGAGRLELIAGRDIDLGAAAGIRSTGDLGNAVLPDEGARLDLIAGVDDIDVPGFVDTYLRDDTRRAAVLADQVTVFMRRVTGNGKLDALAAMERFMALPLAPPADVVECVECFKGRQAARSDLRDLDRSITEFMMARLGVDTLDPIAARLQFLGLPAEEQQPLVVELFFDALGRSGRSNALDSTQGFDAGYEAIEVLFPGTLLADGNVDPSGVIRRDASSRGAINLFFSRIATNDGGDINLLVPGGSVNVGLSASFAGAKPVSELGIVAQRAGSVRAFVDGDFQINQSRVFALDGGDIAVWSTVGDIDAGRGAKSAVSAPPPTVSFDANGNVIVEFPPAIAGSGIRSAVATDGRAPGDILLFAPAGAVVASDAPIISAGDVVIAATQVVGSDISAGGVTVGVPVGSDGLASAVAGASDAATQASSDAASAATNETRTTDAPLARAALGWLEVFLEGFDAGMPAPESERRRRSG